MQNRMKRQQLSDDEVGALLTNQQVGRLSTLSPTGFPYTVPVHFTHHEGKIYIHGLDKGQKIDNINLCSKVCFEIDHMSGLILSEKPCNVNTEYQSVVILGEASMIESHEAKEAALELIVAKYTPQLVGEKLPANAIKATAVIEITIPKKTGKYYR